MEVEAGRGHTRRGGPRVSSLVRPWSAPLGADVVGVDLSEALDDDVVSELRAAWLEHLVLVFRDQDVTVDELLAFAQRFGDVDVGALGYETQGGGRPGVATLSSVSGGGGAGAVDYWHADSTYRRSPPMAGILRAVTLPSRGGDTLFANMYLAYDALSEPLRQLLDGLTAEHSIEVTAQRIVARSGRAMPEPPRGAERPHVHPVVRVHPETGRKLLFVNSSWVTRIVELREAESDALLRLLFEHVKTPELQARLTWTPHTVVMWDNRATQHYGAGDYDEQRTLVRISLAGDEPVGVPGAAGEHAGAAQ